jgi:hypothetical protein
MTQRARREEYLDDDEASCTLRIGIAVAFASAAVRVDVVSQDELRSMHRELNVVVVVELPRRFSPTKKTQNRMDVVHFCLDPLARTAKRVKRKTTTENNAFTNSMVSTMPNCEK